MYKMFPTFVMNEHTTATFDKARQEMDLYKKIKKTRYRKQISINDYSFRQDSIEMFSIRENLHVQQNEKPLDRGRRTTSDLEKNILWFT